MVQYLHLPFPMVQKSLLIWSKAKRERERERDKCGESAEWMILINVQPHHSKQRMWLSHKKAECEIMWIYRPLVVMSTQAHVIINKLQ